MKTNFKNISKHTLSFSLNGKGGGSFVIPPGESAELPADNAHIVALVGKGHLKENPIIVKQPKEKI